MTRRKEILCLIKQKIDEVLNPSEPECNPSLTQEDIFQDLDITKEQYGWALSISPDSDYDLKDDSNDKDSFNNQPSEHLGSQNSSDEPTPGGSITAYNQPLDITDDHLRESVRSLNVQQRDTYNIVLSWCRNKVKNMDSLKPVDIKYLDITNKCQHVTKDMRNRPTTIKIL